MEELFLLTGIPARELSVELLDLELAGRVVSDGSFFSLSL